MPELQAELVSLLAPRAQQQLGDRSNSLEALAAEATLRLCHQGKLQIFVRQITDEVNRIQASRGETLKFTAEKVGHKLKKLGLYTRRLGRSAMDCWLTVRLSSLSTKLLRLSLVQILAPGMKTYTVLYAMKIKGLDGDRLLLPVPEGGAGN